MKKPKTKKSQKFTGKYYSWLRNYIMKLQLIKFDWLKNFRFFLNMFLIFQIFDHFVNIVKNFNPDFAKNVRERLN